VSEKKSVFEPGLTGYGILYGVGQEKCTLGVTSIEVAGLVPDVAMIVYPSSSMASRTGDLKSAADGVVSSAGRLISRSHPAYPALRRFFSVASRRCSFRPVMKNTFTPVARAVLNRVRTGWIGAARARVSHVSSPQGPFGKWQGPFGK
jgi:hypothetical protein